ncbi:uncharacterized protein [Gossypium hirsutum]|uniref:Uncharacterized protein n=1 Tax=Gossypium hirsutum TaxID=3635 RepID=A0ABM3BFN6_GOSHI|nr:uncharacterized protein LOC107918671 [Gossypium hirsutum]
MHLKEVFANALKRLGLPLKHLNRFQRRPLFSPESETSLASTIAISPVAIGGNMGLESKKMQSMMEAAADAGKATIQEKVKKRKKSREPTEKEMGRERKEEALNQKATAWQAGFAAGGLDGGDVNREKTG